MKCQNDTLRHDTPLIDLCLIIALCSVVVGGISDITAAAHQICTLQLSIRPRMATDKSISSIWMEAVASEIINCTARVVERVARG